MKIKFLAAVLGLTMAFGSASLVGAAGVESADSEFMLGEGNVAATIIYTSEMQQTEGNLIDVSQILAVPGLLDSMPDVDGLTGVARVSGWSGDPLGLGYLFWTVGELFCGFAGCAFIQ